MGADSRLLTPYVGTDLICLYFKTAEYPQLPLESTEQGGFIAAKVSKVKVFKASAA